MPGGRGGCRPAFPCRGANGDSVQLASPFAHRVGEWHKNVRLRTAETSGKKRPRPETARMLQRGGLTGE